MNFDLEPELIELRDRVRAFVHDEVIPAESQPFTNELLADLRAKARHAGIFGPQLPREYGGLGLGTVGMCVVFEEAGRSFLGPVALHCSAPDEGNMHRKAAELELVRRLCVIPERHVIKPLDRLLRFDHDNGEGRGQKHYAALTSRFDIITAI